MSADPRQIAPVHSDAEVERRAEQVVLRWAVAQGWKRPEIEQVLASLGLVATVPGATYRPTDGRREPKRAERPCETSASP